MVRPAYPLPGIVIFIIRVPVDPVAVLIIEASQASGRFLAVAEDTLVDDSGEITVFVIFIQFFLLQSPNQKIPDRKTKCVIKTHINIKQNVIFGAKLKPV